MMAATRLDLPDVPAAVKLPSVAIAMSWFPYSSHDPSSSMDWRFLPPVTDTCWLSDECLEVVDPSALPLYGQ